MIDNVLGMTFTLFYIVARSVEPANALRGVTVRIEGLALSGGV